MTFDAERMIASAVERAGHADFGGDGWRGNFQHVVDALNERRYDATASASIEATLVGALAARLSIEGWIKDHPEVEDEVIEGPVIIMGLPRTASTALQNVLAQDQQWRFLRGWEAAEPVPPPVAGAEETNARFLREKAYIDQDTTYLGKHIQTSGGPVEDTALLRLNFGGQEQGWPIFGFTRWWRDQSQVETFRYQARAMRLLQSRRPPSRWILKAPWHSFHLDDLLAAFPAAKLVMTHRNPADVLPSTASLLYLRYRTFLPDEAISKEEVGRWVLEHWAIGIRRAIEFRRRNPDAQIFDLHHGPFNRDPLGVLEKLYAWLCRTMGDPARAAMTEWAAHNRRGVHGEHRYTAEDFGLSVEEIDAAFADYKQSFGL